MEQFETFTPPAFDTVWGFLSKEEPFTLDLMTDPVLGLLEDQRRAVDLSQRRGIDPVPVAAPPAVARRNIPEVFAVPREVLLDVFPANP